MIKRIELKNFMSHEHTVIEPAAGLTVLIGPNNVGKSAIVAALQILCDNRTANFAKRHGTKKCSVIVETDDGHTIEWMRKTSQSYLINGQKFDRLGRNKTPDELHEVLRLPKVLGTNQEEFDVHFGEQKSPIFLLDSTGSTAARFFASSSDAIRLVAMQQRHNEKVRDARKERVRLDKESEELNSELAALEPVVEIERRVEKIERDYHSITTLQRELDQLATFQSTLAKQETLVTADEATANALQPLNSPPKLKDATTLDRLISECTQVSRHWNFATLCQNAFAQFEPPPQLADDVSLQSLVQQMQSLHAETNWNSGQTEHLHSLSPPPQIGDVTSLHRIAHDIAHSETQTQRFTQHVASLRQLSRLELPDDRELTDLLSALRVARQETQQMQSHIEKLKDIELPPPVPTDTEPTRELLERLAAMHKEVDTLTTEFEHADQELQNVADELCLVAEEENCPVCGGRINVERFLQKTAAGRLRS